MTPLETIRTIELKSQYVMLSQLQDLFPRKSVHPVAKKIDALITNVCNELDRLNYLNKK
jgi:hypothetical protein